MPICATLHSYLKTQPNECRQGDHADDPDVHYLLGFEKDKVESLPVKTYIRRLWLAFQSNKYSSMPRCFFDPEAERFAKEVEAWVSDFVKDEDRLASEIAKDPMVLDEKTEKTRSAFLEDTARTLLVTRESGDHLWGSRTFCRSPLANAKREPGDDEPPGWPPGSRLAVRHWLAARLQDKLRSPRQAKDVPRVECPEDSDQRRVTIAAAFAGTTLYDSEEEVVDLVTQQSVDVTEEATQSQRHGEHPPRRRSTTRRKPSAHAIDLEKLQSTCTGSTVTQLRSVSQAGQRQCVRTGATRVSLLSHPKPPAAPLQSSDRRSGNVELNTAVPRVASVAPSSLKRKRGFKYAEPRRTISNARLKSTGLLPTPAHSRVVSQLPSGSAHTSPNGLSSAPVQDSMGLYTSHDGSNGPRQLMPPTKHIVSQDHSHPDRDARMSGVIQRRAGIFVDPQDQCRHSVDIIPDTLRGRNDEGTWETHFSHCRRAAPCPSAYKRHTGDDRCTGKDNSITA